MRRQTVATRRNAGHPRCLREAPNWVHSNPSSEELGLRRPSIPPNRALLRRHLFPPIGAAPSFSGTSSPGASRRPSAGPPALTRRRRPSRCPPRLPIRSALAGAALPSSGVEPFLPVRPAAAPRPIDAPPAPPSDDGALGALSAWASEDVTDLLLDGAGMLWLDRGRGLVPADGWRALDASSA